MLIGKLFNIFFAYYLYFDIVLHNVLSKLSFYKSEHKTIMMQTTVSMEITRNGNALSAVKVVMPTWNRVGNDGLIYASIPFFGLETYGVNDEDTEIAIKEALTCFCVSAEKYGLGLESELEFLGWERVYNTDREHSVFNVFPKNQAIDSVLNTGDARALMLEIA